MLALRSALLRPRSAFPAAAVLRRHFAAKGNREHIVDWMAGPSQALDVASTKFDTLSLGFADDDAASGCCT